MDRALWLIGRYFLEALEANVESSSNRRGASFRMACAVRFGPPCDVVLPADVALAVRDIMAMEKPGSGASGTPDRFPKGYPSFRMALGRQATNRRRVDMLSHVNNIARLISGYFE
ncbi:hypothetical protein [Burkholderia metallica]|uniref:hypothetical protein n=1 Tax=Burkholderia metallica TaxID=488729 RepID=UPI00158BCD6C|nr:hypothetical protein [Burkholderia metallica]